MLLEADIALLPARAEARVAFDELEVAADGWGAPDPVRSAMTAWQFDDATTQIEAADAWLVDRDALLADMEAVGLSRRPSACPRHSRVRRRAAGRRASWRPRGSWSTPTP